MDERLERSSSQESSIMRQQADYLRVSPSNASIASTHNRVRNCALDATASAEIALRGATALAALMHLRSVTTSTPRCRHRSIRR